MTQNKRINIIDEARGALIILVIIYHLFFDLAVIYSVESLGALFDLMHFLQPALPFLFILISGISFWLSRNNLKRGITLLILGMIITLVLWAATPDFPVLFGVLHFLGLMNLSFAPLKNKLVKTPVKADAIICVVCAILFVLTYNIQLGYVGIKGLFSVNLPDFLYQSNVLLIFGFHSPSFFSADYNPVFPWAFVFVIGLMLGKHIEKLPDSLKKPHTRALAFIGRRTLIIYIIHQPIIYCILWLIMR